MPFVVRNGVAFHPRRKDEMVRTKRWQHFEDILVNALTIAKTRLRYLPRIAAVANGSFPFILSHGDHTACNNVHDKEIPIFSWYTTATCNYSWPVPDYHIASITKESTQEWNQQFEMWNQEYPWNEKAKKAVWRGSMTGPNVHDWREKPRAQLVQYSIDQHNQTVDASFVEHSNPTENELQARNMSMVVPRMKEADYMKYRAILDIDGNSWSSRYGILLCFNSVVIKVSRSLEDDDTCLSRHFCCLYTCT